MPTKLDPILFGESKTIDFSKFKIENVVNAIDLDLGQFEIKGVQGLTPKLTDAKNTITYCKSAGLKGPYIRAGVVKNDLVLVVDDKTNDSFEQMAVLIK